MTTFCQFSHLASGSNRGMQYDRKIHWACCARECRNDHHWEASLHACSAMPSHCFLSFLSYCQRIKWCLIPHAKAFLQTNHSQTEKAIRQMQLAYKGNWMHNCRQWKGILRLTVLVRVIQGMNIHLPNFPTVCVLFIFHVGFLQTQWGKKNNCISRDCILTLHCSKHLCLTPV